MLRDKGLEWSAQLPDGASKSVNTDAYELLPELKDAVNNCDGFAYYVEMPALTTTQLPAGSDATPGAWELTITVNTQMLPDESITVGGITFTAALEPEGDTQFALDATASDIAGLIKNKGLAGYTLTKYNGKVTFTEDVPGTKSAPTLAVVTDDEQDPELEAAMSVKTPAAPADNAGEITLEVEQADANTEDGWGACSKFTLGTVTAATGAKAFVYFIPRITKRFIRIAFTTNATASDCSGSAANVSIVWIP